MRKSLFTHRAPAYPSTVVMLLVSACMDSEWLPDHRDSAPAEADASEDAEEPDAGGKSDASVEDEAAVALDAAAEPDAALEPDAAPEPDAALEPDTGAELDAETCMDAAEDAAVEPDAPVAADAGTEPDAASGPRSCGGPQHVACGDGEFCNTGMPIGALDSAAYSCSAADLLGFCAPQPAAADCQAAPQIAVCGCDGFYHPSACEAHARGIPISYDRNCNIPPNACGVSELQGGFEVAQCSDPNSVCVPSSCFPGLAVFGRCEARPSQCSDVDEPVCSCGVLTYRNACLALQAGVSAMPGACAANPAPRSCHSPFYVGVDLGCLDNQYCNTSTHCRRPPSSIPGEGWCQDIPASCPTESAPVCGCNGVTYPNACEAHRALASVASQGPC